jgi:2-haloacid dehalogenase
MIKAICFDVIGTVVDWRGSITAALAAHRVGPNIASEFADRWARFYAEGSFKSEADIAAEGRRLLVDYGVADRLTEQEAETFAGLWTRLSPWPDAIEGLNRLSARHWCVPLSNVGRSMMRRLSRNVGLFWGDILSTEAVGVKKPDPKCYQYAVDQICCRPSEIMMVAAHRFDLRGAKEAGFQTAYVQRRDDRPPTPEDGFDFLVNDFHELADHLGC